MRNQRFLVFLSLLLSISAAQADTPWVLKREMAGIKIHQKPTSTGYALTRGELVIPASIGAIMTAMEDRATCARWVYACKTGHLVKQHNPMQRLDYTVTDSPLWFADRDVYIESQASFNASTKTLTIKLTGKENYDQGQSGRVRISGLYGLWQLKETSPKMTQLLYQVHANPQLQVRNYPKSLVSFYLKAYMVESVFQTLSNLKRVAIKTTPREDISKYFAKH